MRRLVLPLLLLTAMCLQAETPKASEAGTQASRDATREKTRQLLEAIGRTDGVQIVFQKSEKQPYNFFGTLRSGLKNADALEVVVAISANDAINFRIYPHYKGAYINTGKVQDGPGLMHRLLQFNNTNFLYWGEDETKDVFFGYTVSLESGFPSEVLRIVLRSIPLTDPFLGELRPFIDGTTAAVD